MPAPTVIIRGRIDRKEFTEPFRQCAEMLEGLGINGCVNPASVDVPADMFLFFQSYPHEFLPSDLEQLRRSNPFAPFFFTLGVCCEGMLRTAGPLASPFYCYVHAWSSREIEHIRLFLTDQPSVFTLPMTTGEDEIALWLDSDGRRQTADGSREGGRDGGVAASILPSAVCRLPSLILTRFGPFGNDSAMNQLLADEQRRLGFEPEFCCRLPSAVCRLPILADADSSPKEKILETIQSLRHRFADNDFTVYVDSPRIDEKDAYVQAGATRVLPKMR